MVDFSRRSEEPELMDGADVSQDDFSACLADLAQVNTLTLARAPTLAFIREALAAWQGKAAPVILDVGYGAGDMLRAIHRMATRMGQKVQLIGIDLNPRSEPVAAALTAPGASIEYRIGDLYDWPQGEGVDIVISSLVTHHMTDDEILHFLGWMEANARLGWFVNDLHRHWLAYHAFRLFSAAMRWHKFVRHDGPLSVARAFVRRDWERLLGEARLSDAALVTWKFPFRYCLARRKW
ncbi:MAG: methyltransferase domain-containing protein [Novosphingobium sp.]|nr:methyltransferase domain-containing protein [Novosphingobium sp.]